MYSQSVGINTTNPDPLFKLDVNGPITSNGLRTIGGSNYISIFDQVNTNQYWNWQSSGGYSRFAYNTVSPLFSRNVLVINNDGKVGIGTANPTAWLDVNNTTVGGQTARFNGGNNMYISLAENGINRGYIGSFYGNAEDIEFSTHTTNTTGKIQFATNTLPRLIVEPTGEVRVKNINDDPNFIIQGNASDFKKLSFQDNLGAEKHSITSINDQVNFKRNNLFLPDMVWDADGDLGIGNIAPATKLHISGGDDAGMSSNGYIINGLSNSTNMVIDNNEILVRNNGASADMYLQHDAGNLLLCGNEGGTVGIGITSSAFLPAGSLLAVDGKITCEEVLVKLSENWPDYVFAEDYELTPLKDVKTFIETHKHLPGIPKANDVKNNGLEVGHVQKLMMEKIEELTLYIIQLKEEIDVLKKKND